MDEINRIDLINKNNEYNRMMYRLGYTHSKLFRDMEMLKDYNFLIEDEIKPAEAFKMLGVKYGITTGQARYILKRLFKEV